MWQLLTAQVQVQKRRRMRKWGCEAKHRLHTVHFRWFYWSTDSMAGYCLASCLANGHFCTWLMGLSGQPLESWHQALLVECLIEGVDGGGMSTRTQTHVYNHSNTADWFERNRVPLGLSVIQTHHQRPSLCRTIDRFFSCQRINSVNFSLSERKLQLELIYLFCSHKDLDGRRSM